MSTFFNTTSPSDRDYVRLYIGDTNEQFPIFTNEELDMFVSANGGVFEACEAACLSVAASKSRQAVSISLPGTTITKTSAPTHYLALAEKFHDMATSGAVADTSNWFTQDAAHYDAITGRASVDLDTPSTE